MTVDELNAKKEQLLKDLDNVAGEAIAQVKAQIAAIDWEIEKLTPPAAPAEEAH